MSEPENVKGKALNVANDAAEKAKNLSQEGIKKADELYNKLPLDKMNEKFGGKVDFRSSKLKYSLFFAVGIIVLLVIIGIFSLSSSNDVVIPKKFKERTKAIINLDDDLLREYSMYSSATRIKPKYGEETFGDYVKRCKASLSDQQIEAYQKGIEGMDADMIRASLKQSLK